MARPKNKENRTYSVINLGARRIVYDDSNKLLVSAIKKLKNADRTDVKLSGKEYNALETGYWLSV